MKPLIGRQDSAARALAGFIDGLSKSGKNDLGLTGELILDRDHCCMNGWTLPTRTASGSTLGYLVRLGWIDMNLPRSQGHVHPCLWKLHLLTDLQTGLGTLTN